MTPCPRKAAENRRAVGRRLASSMNSPDRQFPIKLSMPGLKLVLYVQGAFSLVLTCLKRAVVSGITACMTAFLKFSQTPGDLTKRIFCCCTLLYLVLNMCVITAALQEFTVYITQIIFNIFYRMHFYSIIILYILYCNCILLYINEFHMRNTFERNFKPYYASTSI